MDEDSVGPPRADSAAGPQPSTYPPRLASALHTFIAPHGVQTRKALIMHLRQRISVELKPVPDFYSGPVSVFFQIHTLLRVKHYCAVREGLLAALQVSSNSGGGAGGPLWAELQSTRDLYLLSPSPDRFPLVDSEPTLFFFSLSQTSLFSNSSPSCRHSHHSPSKRYFQASLTHHKLMFAEPATFTSGSSEETPPRLRVLKWDLSDDLVSTPTPQPHIT